MSVERAQLLYQQARYSLAENELRHALSLNPQSAYAHSLLALTLMHLKQLKDATAEAQQAIHVDPAYAFAHYALAKVWYKRDRAKESRTAIEEAIRLDVENPDYRFLLGAIHYDEKRFKEALQLAEEGLQFDPEHGSCTNLRAMTLVKLGRRVDAGKTISAALARNPENAAAHANLGWSMLHEGNATEALGHFKESLRLNPNFEWARQGIVEALKARNRAYATMLRGVLWISTLSPRERAGLYIGGYLLSRLTGLMLLWVIAIWFTWIAKPFFNLLLRLDRFGRLALSPEQIVESNWVGGVLITSVLSLLAYFVSGQDPPLVSAIVFACLALPVAGIFRIAPGWPRTAMMVYVGLMVMLGIPSIFVVSFAAENDPRNAPFWIFLILALLSGLIATALVRRSARR